MIEIDLNSTPKGKSKFVLNGSIEVKGEVSILAKEMYAIIKDFEENATEAWFIALDKRMNEAAERLEEV